LIAPTRVDRSALRVSSTAFSSRSECATRNHSARPAHGRSIPRIAQHAGLTPGAIYRRFHDKDALLEATILGMLAVTISLRTCIQRFDLLCVNKAIIYV
jgi:AcrR family transcriptional regulator